jgi:hypothetical protein
MNRLASAREMRNHGVTLAEQRRQSLDPRRGRVLAFEQMCTQINMCGVERPLQVHVAYMAGGQEEDAILGNVTRHRPAAEIERHIDRAAAVQDHQAVGQRMKTAFERPFALVRGVGRSPAESLAGRADPRAGTLQHAVGFAEGENRATAGTGWRRGWHALRPALTKRRES